MNAKVLLETDPLAFVDSYLEADAKAVRSVLEQLSSSKHAYAVMLRAWATPERTWAEAMKVVSLFAKPYTLAYKKKWLRELATRETVLDAVRAAAVGAAFVPPRDDRRPRHRRQ